MGKSVGDAVAVTGAVVGWSVGATEGLTVGNSVLGAAEGLSLTVGAFEIEGADEGVLLGEATGVREVDGCVEGLKLMLGAADGVCVGPFEGLTEGRFEGALLAATDGADDGEAEGAAEAEPLGANDGAAEAKREGAALAVGVKVILSRAKRRCELSPVRGTLLAWAPTTAAKSKKVWSIMVEMQYLTSWFSIEVCSVWKEGEQGLVPYDVVSVRSVECDATNECGGSRRRSYSHACSQDSWHPIVSNFGANESLKFMQPSAMRSA